MIFNERQFERVKKPGSIMQPTVVGQAYRLYAVVKITYHAAESSSANDYFIVCIL